MKWGEICDDVYDAQNNVSEASELAPSYRWGEAKAEAEELDQWTMNEMYRFLKESLPSIKAAMKKLEPHLKKEE